MGSARNWDELVGTADEVRRVYESVPVPMVAFAGAEHRFMAANAAYRALLPRLDPVSVQRPVREALPEIMGQFVFEVFDEVYETGRAHRAHEWRLQLDLDGSGVLQERFFDFIVSARRDDADRIDGVQIVVFDVTDRVRARQAADAHLAEISERFGQVQASATLVQRALLASSVPILPGVDVAAEYLVAADDSAAGGDWFDAIADDDGVLHLVVGDVAGHGVEAAAVMAQLRTATRVHIRSGKSISETLAAVDEFAGTVAGARLATLCLGRLDPGSGVLEYCTAGHPPPLLIVDGSPRFGPPSGAQPLGSGGHYPTVTEMLGRGDAVLFYSDGLIERPGRPLVASTAEFADLAARLLAGSGMPADTTRPVERLCFQTLELLLRNTGYSDDVTLIAAQRIPVLSPLHLDVNADRHATTTIRESLRRWLGDLGADATNVMIIEHTISEYVDNAAEHAYAQPGGVVSVDAHLGVTGTLHVTVVDHGNWKPAEATHPARGLQLASTLIAHTRVVPGPEGTRVELTHPLTRPARIVTEPGYIAQNLDSGEEFDLYTEQDALVVTGDIDTVHAPVLAGRITGLTNSGTRSLIINLSAVTHLGSAAVRTLMDAHDVAREQHSTLTLIAPPGSTAHHVLTLVGLPTAATHHQAQ